MFSIISLYPWPVNSVRVIRVDKLNVRYMSQFLHPKIRIALLDDHDVVRFGLSVKLKEEDDFDIVGIYENAASFIAGLRDNPAEVLVVDFSLGPNDIDGVSLIRALKIKFPASKVLIVSSHCDMATIALALRVGAHGFVGKDQGLSKIVHAIRKVSIGEIYQDPGMSLQMAETFTTSVDADNSESMVFSAKLSAREREVIRCYLDGLTVSEIAHKFGRSIKTVSTQKSTAYRKLGVTSDNGLFKLKHLLGNI